MTKRTLAVAANSDSSFRSFFRSIGIGVLAKGDTAPIANTVLHTWLRSSHFHSNTGHMIQTCSITGHMIQTEVIMVLSKRV